MKNGSISCNDGYENIEITYPDQEHSKPTKTNQPTVLPKDSVPEPLTVDCDDPAVNEQSTDGLLVDLDDFLTSAERAYRFIQKNDTNSRIILSLYNFFEVVARGIFPITNIALMLFLDTVDYFNAPSAEQVRYRKETKYFWFMGFRLFHGKFLR